MPANALVLADRPDGLIARDQHRHQGRVDFGQTLQVAQRSGQQDRRFGMPAAPDQFHRIKQPNLHRRRHRQHPTAIDIAPETLRRTKIAHHLPQHRVAPRPSPAG